MIARARTPIVARRLARRLACGRLGSRPRRWRSGPAPARAGAAAQEADVIVSHGISTFGDLKYPADFAHFDYVNPDAPKGGTMSFRGTGASQTFDSLNAFILKGEPAQGLGLLYDSLLAGSADEPDAAYGLIAETLEYPEDRVLGDLQHAPRGDLLGRRADHRRGRGLHLRGAAGEGRAVLPDHAPGHRRASRRSTRTGSSSPSATAPRRATCPRSPAACRSCRSTTTTRSSSTESTLIPPVGSGAYVVADVQPGRSIKYCRNPDYWGKDLPVNVGANNFDCYVYEYFADNTAAFEALKVGDYLFHEEFFSSALGDRLRLSGAREGLGQARGRAARQPPVRHPGLLVQPAPREVPGPARARGDRR